MKRYLLLILVALLFAGGCAEESSRPKATGDGRVRAINAIATSPDYGFLIEERLLSALRYKSSSEPFTWDDLEYTFNFEVLLMGETEPTRVASVFIDVVKDMDYTLLLSGAYDAPDVTIWESERREWGDGDTTFEIRFANTSTVLGPIDVYFDVPGVTPVAGNQLGTLDFGEILPVLEFDTSERVLILTPANDPGTVLYESLPITLIERNSYIVMPFDQDANDVGPIPVVLINASQGGVLSVADVNTQSTARFFHGSIDMGNVDIYTDDPLTAPLVSNQAFGEFTDDLSVPSNEVPITYTTAGNMGSILIDADRVFGTGRRYNVFAVRNDAGDDVLGSYLGDRRSVATQYRLTLANTSTNLPVIDIYAVPTGETIDEVPPRVSLLTTLTQPTIMPLLPGQYDLYVTLPLEKTILLGPISLDAQAGDVEQAVIFDTVDPNVPEFVFIPLP